MPLQILHDDERSVIGTLRNVAFVGWRDAPQVPDIQRWHALGRSIASAYPGRGACFDVVARGRPDFAEPMRREAVRFASDAGIFPLGFAHVVLAPGLTGTAVRAFIGTVLLLARPPSPAKVFGALEPAVAWLAPSLAADGHTVPALRDAGEQLVATLGR